MGLLDKIVKEQAREEEAKTKKELDSLSKKELENRKKEDFKRKSLPLILQALDEFPEACMKAGIDPLPLLIRKKRGFFDKKMYSCLWGYYLIPYFSRWYIVFMARDGSFHAHMKEVRVSDGPYKQHYEKKRDDIPACWSTDIDVDRPEGSRKDYTVKTPVRNIEGIGRDEVRGLIADQIISKAFSLTENDNIANPAMHEAFERGDCETAVLNIFSEYMKRNSNDRDTLLRNNRLTEFYMSLKKD